MHNSYVFSGYAQPLHTSTKTQKELQSQHLFSFTLQPPPGESLEQQVLFKKNFFADNLMFSNVLCLSSTQLFQGLGERESTLISLTSEEIWSKVVTSVAELSDLAFIGQCKCGQQRIQMQTDSPLLRNNK